MNDTSLIVNRKQLENRKDSSIPWKEWIECPAGDVSIILSIFLRRKKYLIVSLLRTMFGDRVDNRAFRSVDIVDRYERYQWKELRPYDLRIVIDC